MIGGILLGDWYPDMILQYCCFWRTLLINIGSQMFETETPRLSVASETEISETVETLHPFQM